MDVQEAERETSMTAPAQTSTSPSLVPVAVTPEPKKRKSILDYFNTEREETPVKKIKIETEQVELSQSTSTPKLEPTPLAPAPTPRPPYDIFFNQASISSGALQYFAEFLGLKDIGCLSRVSLDFLVLFAHPSIWNPILNNLKAKYGFYKLGTNAQYPKRHVEEFYRLTRGSFFLRLYLSNEADKHHKEVSIRDTTKLYLTFEFSNISAKPFRLLRYVNPAPNFNSVCSEISEGRWGLRFVHRANNDTNVFTQWMMSHSPKSDFTASNDHILVVKPENIYKADDVVRNRENRAFAKIMFSPASSADSAKDSRGKSINDFFQNNRYKTPLQFALYLVYEFQAEAAGDFLVGEFSSSPVFLTLNA